jgi:hypothetical protein
MKVRRRRSRFHIYIIAALIVVFLLLILNKIYTDYLWFSKLGFETVWSVSIWTKVMIFLAAAILFFLIVGINLYLAQQSQKIGISLRIKLIILAVISLFVGLSFQGQWMTVLSFLNRTSFGLKDPIFSNDISFYVFTLPFLNMLWSFAALVATIALIAVVLGYFESMIKQLFTGRSAKIEVRPNDPVVHIKRNLKNISRNAKIHIAIMTAVLFILFGLKHILERYNILYSTEGVVFGAGYTDTAIILPSLILLSIVAFITAAIIIAWGFFPMKILQKKKHILTVLIIIYLVINFLGTIVVPGIVQHFVVNPNEINLEQRFIENNIKYTLLGYNLVNVEQQNVDIQDSLTYKDLMEEQGTLHNIRILDWRPLEQSYKQLQEIRPYYDLSEIDIDRYTIGGNYTQVMLSPREMLQSSLDPNAQTWLNRHLVYTHGYGVVMSPVSSVTPQGRPKFLIQDIPPITDYPNLEIERPEIYYGMKTDNFVFVNTKTDEFNYPKGDENIYTNYEGEGGVEVDGFVRKASFALRFQDINILLSPNIKDDSRVMFNRNIQKRINEITPFLILDRDPYIVVEDGKVYWIQDAYTASSSFPYSEPIQVNNNVINYIRNSVKVVVDAYSGKTTYYVFDTKDPLIKTYMKMFPDLFEKAESMPEGLRNHIRYPELIFTVQTEIYKDYHMLNPKVFYTKEDAWERPTEVYGTNAKQIQEPYYITMKLPESEETEFILMTSYTPKRKANIISWFAAKCDDEYGKLVLYKFQKDKVILGPEQIEAMISSDSDFSQLETLWGGSGSRVLRGNLLVIPIKDSLLYVEPIYLEAESSEIPELKKIVVSDGTSVVIEDTFEESIEKLFLGRVPEDEEPGDELPGQDRTQSELIDEAGKVYEDIEEAMEDKDWTQFGIKMDELEEVLEKLKSSTE